MADKPIVEIFCDGGCKPNPGPGGWGAILRYPKKGTVKELSGAAPDTTNNRMELTAVIEAFSVLKIPCDVRVTTDSEYLANAFRQHWLENWKRKGWKTSTKEPVKNQDLWMRLDELCQKHTVTWHWTRGHVGHRENERCDQMATDAREDLVAGRGR